MVESISDEKADDPHGSESHLSEVAHEGEDATFGETAHDSVSTDEGRFTSDETVTLNVPSDYDTVQSAVTKASEIHLRRGTNVEINIESGFTVETRTAVEDGNYSFIRLVSEDAEVPCNFPGTDFDDDVILYGVNCWMPTVDCLFDMQGTGSDGIYLNEFSRIYVNQDAGVKNAGRFGINARQASSARVRGGVFTGAAEAGIHARHSSYVVGQNTDCSGSETGAFARWNGFIDLYGADLSECEIGIDIEHGGMVAAHGDATISNCSTGVRADHGGSVDARSADISGCSNHSVRAINGAEISVEGANMDNSTDAVRADDGGKVTAANSSIDSAERAILSIGGVVYARNAGMTNAQDNVIDSRDGSQINVEGADMSDPSEPLINARSGSTIEARNVTAAQAPSFLDAVQSGDGSRVNIEGADFGDAELEVTNGSIIVANNAVHGATNEDTNTLTANGIIFS